MKLSRRGFFGLSLAAPAAVAMAKETKPKIFPMDAATAKAIGPQLRDHRVIHEAFMLCGIIKFDETVSQNDFNFARMLLRKAPGGIRHPSDWLAMQLMGPYGVPADHISSIVKHNARMTF